MTEPDAPRPRRAAHRGRRSPAAGLLPLLFVVLAVAAVAVGAVVVTRALSGTGRPAASSPTPSLTPTPSTTNPSPSHSSPSHSPVDTTSASPTATTSASSSPSPTPTRSHHSSPPVAAPKIPVTVFNQTSVPGAAAALAAQLSDLGWPIACVDNWVGFVPSTTVYYWPGDEGSAQRLAGESPEVNRVRPASAPMPTGSLVVIIAG